MINKTDRNTNYFNFVIIVLAFCFTFAIGRERGLPLIDNYPPEVYDAQEQNWAIVQDKNGFMYFGNTDGSVRNMMV